MHETDDFEALRELQTQNGLLATKLLKNEYYSRRFNLAAMKNCNHIPGHPAHCNTPVCLLCRRWKNQEKKSTLIARTGGRQGNPRERMMAVSGTLTDVDTSDIRHAARHLRQSWARLQKPLHGLAGSFYGLEIDASKVDPSEENVHFHGLLALGTGHAGRYRYSRKDWAEAWQEAAGSTARDLYIEQVESIEGTASYIFPTHFYGKKGFLTRAKEALNNPQRYAERVRQLSYLPKYSYRGELQLLPIGE